MIRRVLPCMLATLLVTSASDAENLPILIDGLYADWTPGSFLGGDLTGDAGSSGIDLTELFVANDENRLFIQFDTTVEVQGDEQQNLVIAIDTDRNPSTGWSVGSIGAELEWRLGDRSGFEHFGSSSSIDHPEIGLVLSPTVSATRMELGLDRDAFIGGNPLFAQPDFDIYIFDDDAGDAIGPYTYTFVEGSQPVASIGLDRDDVDHVRVGAYNVQNDGLFDGGSTASALGRLMVAASPDVWILNEVWNHDAGEVADRVDELQPAGPGRSWDAVKLDTGNVVASLYPILDSWEVSPGDRLTAVLLDVRPTYDSDFLVVANHWSCCTADDSRQRQADALVAFLRDARTPGGAVTLTADTPIVAGGDFNLVGLRQQLDTLVSGDIVDNGTYGPDSPPDWDGTSFNLARPRHPDARLVYTWRNDFSSFYPGKLDYIFYTASAATLHNRYVLETRTMTAGTLAAYGLQAGDTEDASDHAPVVADFSVGGTTSVSDAVVPSMHLTARPNPFATSTTITFDLTVSTRISVDVFDVTGRHVRHLGSGELSEGRHAMAWDGTDKSGALTEPGVFIARVSGDGIRDAIRIVRAR